MNGNRFFRPLICRLLTVSRCSRPFIRKKGDFSPPFAASGSPVKKPVKNGKKRGEKLFAFLAICLLAAAVFRETVGDWAYVPTSSMEPTVRAGSWVWYEKHTYGALYPRRFAEIPLLNWLCISRSFDRADRLRDWGYRRLPGKRPPRRMDVVVFAFPSAPRQLVMKRIVGMPGDTVEIREGSVYINGRLLPESGVRRPEKSEVAAAYPAIKKDIWTTRNYGPLVIPARNRAMAVDSAFVAFYGDLLENEGQTICRIKNKWLVNGRVAGRCVFRRNYYFVLGDNRGNSLDSRFNGLVSETAIRGRIVPPAE